MPCNETLDGHRIIDLLSKGEGKEIGEKARAGDERALKVINQYKYWQTCSGDNMAKVLLEVAYKEYKQAGEETFVPSRCDTKLYTKGVVVGSLELPPHTSPFEGAKIGDKFRLEDLAKKGHKSELKAQMELNKLSVYLLSYFPGETKPGESTVDAVIRLLGSFKP